MRRPSKMTGDRINPLYKVWETLLLHAKASDAKKELPPEVFEATSSSLSCAIHGI